MGDKRLRRLICVPLLAVCLAAAAFAATGAFGASGRHATPTAVRAGAAGLARFGVLDRAAATSLPAALRGSVPSRFRLDLSRAREVRPATDPGSWYVVPGPDDLCFFDGNGWACNSIANAQAGYLFTVLIPRAANGAAPQDRRISIEGMVPDGVTSVRVSTLTGADSVVPVVGNCYVVRATAVKSVAFEGTAAPAPIPLRG